MLVQKSADGCVKFQTVAAPLVAGLMLVMVGFYMCLFSAQ
jgi:hypothetical protein